MSLRVAILTSNDVRHRYFARAVAERFDVVAAFYQDTGYAPADTAKDEIDDQTARIVRMHFEERSKQERAFFGADADALVGNDTRMVRTVNVESLNTSETSDLLEGQRADVVVIYGTGLIKPPLLDRFAGRMINMHLGLSPYYRGTATNFYPLVNGEPEYVGATIHTIDAGIDSGAIYHHARPEITAGDMPHTVGCKAILAGIEKVLLTLGEIESGSARTVPQWPVENPRLYLRKQYHPSQVVQLYKLIEEGLFPSYVARKHDVENAFRLVS